MTALQKVIGLVFSTLLALVCDAQREHFQHLNKDTALYFAMVECGAVILIIAFIILLFTKTDSEK